MCHASWTCISRQRRGVVRPLCRLLRPQPSRTGRVPAGACVGQGRGRRRRPLQLLHPTDPTARPRAQGWRRHTAPGATSDQAAGMQQRVRLTAARASGHDHSLYCEVGGGGVVRGTCSVTVGPAQCTHTRARTRTSPHCTTPLRHPNCRAQTAALASLCTPRPRPLCTHCDRLVFARVVLARAEHLFAL